MPPTPAPPTAGRRARRIPLLVAALAGTVVVLTAFWFAGFGGSPGQRSPARENFAAIAIGGYIHLCLYRNGFRAVPKIGTGFLLQVVTSAVLAGTLLIGREQILRVGRFLVRRSVAVRGLGLGLSSGRLPPSASPGPRWVSLTSRSEDCSPRPRRSSPWSPNWRGPRSSRRPWCSTTSGRRPSRWQMFSTSPM